MILEFDKEVRKKFLILVNDRILPWLNPSISTSLKNRFIQFKALSGAEYKLIGGLNYGS